MITIRPVEDADLETLFEQQDDPIAAEMAAFPSRNHDEFMARWARIQADPDAIARTVEFDGRIAGNMMSWRGDGLRYVGYWIGREFWGRGIGTEALIQLVAELTERPLYALVVVTNIGSQRVLEKSGFVQIAREMSPEGGLEEFVYRLD